MAEPCTSCGACCDGGAPVFGDDTYRPDPVWLYEGDQMRVETDGGATRCAALFGRIGTFAMCHVYTNRPDACRYFEPGSPECGDARSSHGLPLLPVAPSKPV